MNELPPSPLSQLPYLTSNLPGIGGIIKSSEADFIVEEIPRYEPCGEGTHVFFQIEKTGLTTLESIRRIARALGKKTRDIGYAGLKDARGITRQVLSIEHVDPQTVAQLDLPKITIVWTRLHTNKLKLGHQAGNRFEITIRDCIESPLQTAQPIIEILKSQGMPNYYGPQRFGMRGNNATIAAAIMKSDYTEAIACILGKPLPTDSDQIRQARMAYDNNDYETATGCWPPQCRDELRLCKTVVKAGGPNERVWKTIDQKIRRLYASAWQSEMFNRVVADRITQLAKLETGDVAWIHRNGACFSVEDATAEQPRCDSFEISPTGPMFGAKMKKPEGKPGLREQQLLENSGVTVDLKKTPDGIKLDGARRPLRVPVTDLSATEGTEEDKPYLKLTFSLPSGSYATSLIREISK